MQIRLCISIWLTYRLAMLVPPSEWPLKPVQCGFLPMCIHTLPAIVDVKTSASCLIASWPWSDMSARRSAHASTTFAGFGSSDVTWTLIPWNSWCPLSSSVDSTTVTLFYTGYLNLPSALCNECRTPLRGSHLVCHRVIMSVRRWRSCTGCQSLIVFSTRSRFWCLWYTTIAVPCI